MDSRVILKFYGGKCRLAPWIIRHFPPHQVYLEPCGGAGSVLLHKTPAKLDIYNDIDERLVTFMRVLRDRGPELIDHIRLTPYSRTEFEQARWCPNLSDVEQARRVWVQLNMSISGTFESRWSPITALKHHNLHANSLARLAQVGERLQAVILENDDLFKIIERYDHPGTLMYIDPPYPHRTRKHCKMYAQEWHDTRHLDLARRLHDAQAYVVLSGYAGELYDRLYADWPMRSCWSLTNGNKRRECLWLSPRTAEAWRQSRAQLELFDPQRNP